MSNVEAGLKRWEFGELAFQTAQLYFGQYMRTSGAGFLWCVLVLNGRKIMVDECK